ncbi:hypothetical protein CGCS363_v010131 [Colletotrichum siamense]|uniref:uncharacterized protein n=1 Tax=Colletotrichum siamense TaxID=690259 RepID=UPI0018731DA9|nr:uncharacterized protein CGCS363_v010131 [Colletotrichum siamense]KAF5495042.1 hypothetical protein CGCS363_v010131 [Colletotrichum siamense]
MPNTSVDLVVARVTNPSIPGHSGEGSEHIPVFVIPLWPGLRAAMLPLKVGKAYHFDTHGDLTLKVGGNRSAYHFLVCSRTLRRSSPVFEAMLFRGFAESKPADSAAWTIQLPDDDPSVILLVLSIIHGHFQLVTRELKEYQLHEVLVVTEKYDMTKILNPWASTWFAPYKERSLINSQNAFSLVWSSWELGHKDAFSRFARGIMLQQPINVEGELVTDEITLSRLSDSPFLQPPGLLESIAQGRKVLIGDITTLLYNTIQRLYTAPLCNGKPTVRCNTCGCIIGHGDIAHSTWCIKCKCKRGTTKGFHLSQRLCGDLVFGSLSKRVAGLGLKDVAFLETPTPECLLSVNKLSAEIQGMTIDLPEEHKECNPLPALKDEMQKLVDCVSAPITDAHILYLDKQAKKTGI